MGMVSSQSSGVMTSLLRAGRRAGLLRAGHLRAALGAVLATLALTGCITMPADMPPFDAEQKAFAAEQITPGSGVVKGYAFFHAWTGRTYTAGGDWVDLFPVTPYAQARMQAIYGSNKRRFYTVFGGPPAGDPDYHALRRRTKADIHGRFKFEDVKPGRWYVIASVGWERGDEAYRVGVYEEIEVKPNETVDVVLSGN